MPEEWTCEHDRLVLVESGYEREWEWEANGDGTISLVEDFPASFSDEGDGTYRLECKSCLTVMPLPEGWGERAEWS